MGADACQPSLRLARRQLLDLQSELEMRTRGASPPTVNFPSALQKLHLRALAEVKGRRRDPAIKTLRKPEKGFRPPIASLRRPPNRYVQRFLFDDLRNSQDDQHGLSRERAQLERASMSRRFRLGIRGYQN